MVAFAPILQADLSGAAFGAAPTWTDLTRFARLKASPVGVNAWRQDELSDVAPSTATIILDNADLPGDATAPNAGRFTPDLTTSPWYPHILPGVRMRFGVTVNATTYWLIDGEADSWDAGAEDGDFPTCTVVITDLLAKLGTDPLRSIYAEEVLLDTPLVFWPLTDGSSATTAGNIAATVEPPLTAAQAPAGGGDFNFGGTGIPTDGAGALRLNASLTTAAGDDFKGYHFSAPVGAAGNLGLSFGFTVEAWVLIDPNLSAAAARTLVSGVCAFPIIGFVDQFANLACPLGIVWVNATSKMHLGYFVETKAGAFTATWDPALINLNDGLLHHLAVTVDAGSNVTFYVDGVSTGTASNAFAGLVKFNVGGRTPETGRYGLQPEFRGTVQYLAGYPTVLSAARITAHRNAGVTAFAGEGTATHMSRLLSYRTNLGSTLDTGQGAVGAHQTGGVSEQQALLDTAKAEGGVVYMDGTSKLVFLDRTRIRNPAVAATLDITAQQVDQSLRIRKDRQQVLNDVTITRTGGSAQRVVNTASVNSDGDRAKSDTLLVATDSDALNAAGWRVANSKTPRQRSSPLVVDLLTEPSNAVAQAVLALAPLKRVSLTSPPSWMPASDVIVQGVTWTVGVDVFTASFFTSPMPRPTLRFDAVASAFTKLDSGNVFAW